LKFKALESARKQGRSLKSPQIFELQCLKKVLRYKLWLQVADCIVRLFKILFYYY